MRRDGLVLVSHLLLSSFTPTLSVAKGITRSFSLAPPSPTNSAVITNDPTFNKRYYDNGGNCSVILFATTSLLLSLSTSTVSMVAHAESSATKATSRPRHDEIIDNVHREKRPRTVISHLAPSCALDGSGSGNGDGELNYRSLPQRGSRLDEEYANGDVTKSKRVEWRWPLFSSQIRLARTSASSTSHSATSDVRKLTSLPRRLPTVTPGSHGETRTHRFTLTSLRQEYRQDQHPLLVRSESPSWRSQSTWQHPQNNANATASTSKSEILRKLNSYDCFVRHRNADANSSSAKVIRILALFALTNASSSSLRVIGRSEVAAAILAAEHVNQMQILGCDYRLQIIVNDTRADPGVAVYNFFYAMFNDKRKTIKALLASSQLEVTRALAKISSAWHVPTISFTELSPQLSDIKKYSMFFRIVAPDSAHNSARIAFLRFFKWNVVTTIYQQEDRYFWAINDLSIRLEESNVTQEKSISFSEQDFVAHLKLVQDRGSRIIIASFSHKVAPKFFCKVHDMSMYGGDYVWILPASLRNEWWNAEEYCSKQKLLETLNGTILIGSKRQLDEEEFSISFVDETEFIKSLPRTKSDFVREIYDAVWSTALALSHTLAFCKREETDCSRKSVHTAFQNNFSSNFQRIQFKGVSGPVLFQGADRICISNFYQIQNGRVFRIAEYNPLNSKLNFNCTRCKDIVWPSGYIPISQRTYQLHTVYVAPLAFAMVNLVAVTGILTSLGFLIFNIYYREQKYIKLSSPYLNATTVFGCVLVYLAVIFLGIDSNTMPKWFNFRVICTARVTLLSTGCSLAFGSIFAKTYRVHQIFIKSNHGILKSKVLQDSRLVPIIGLFVLVDGIIITSWTVFDPMNHHFHNLTTESSVVHSKIIHQLRVEVCNSEYKNTWLFALVIYKAAFLVLGLYMAWETRNVKIPSLNDSEYIGLTVYTVSITVVLHFTLANVISERITLAYVTSTSLILFTTTSSMCLLFVPKINVVIESRSGAEKKLVGTTELKIESNTIRFVKNDDQEPYYRVHIQNFAYRKYIAFLDKEIQNLHYRIYMKKDDEPDLWISKMKTSSTTSAKIYDKLPNWRGKYRREKSSSLCGGGIPNLFMLTVLPVVIPRASWPYAEPLDRPIAEEISFSSESKLQNMRFETSSSSPPPPLPQSPPPPLSSPPPSRSLPLAASSPNRRMARDYAYIAENERHAGLIHRMYQRRDSDSQLDSDSPSKGAYDPDEYHDTSSDVDEIERPPTTVMKICKAIIHKTIASENDIASVTPVIKVTDPEENQRG